MYFSFLKMSWVSVGTSAYLWVILGLAAISPVEVADGPLLVLFRGPLHSQCFPEDGNQGAVIFDLWLEALVDGVTFSLLNHILKSGCLSFNDVRIDVWFTLPLINSYSCLCFHCYMNLFCKTSQLRASIILNRSGGGQGLLANALANLSEQAQGERFHLSAFQYPGVLP